MAHWVDVIDAGPVVDEPLDSPAPGDGVRTLRGGAGSEGESAPADGPPLPTAATCASITFCTSGHALKVIISSSVRQVGREAVSVPSK